MKSITRLSLALIMFSLFSISHLATVAAQQDSATDSSTTDSSTNEDAGQHQTSDGEVVGKTRGDNGGRDIKKLTFQDTPDIFTNGESGSNYKHLTQPTNQGGIKGVVSGECTDARRLTNDC